jgi:hypothetical protein
LIVVARFIELPKSPITAFGGVSSPDVSNLQHIEFIRFFPRQRRGQNDRRGISWFFDRLPCYEPTNIAARRDSLFWSWRRIAEYFRDLSESGSIGQDTEEHGKRREVIRIDPSLRKS